MDRPATCFLLAIGIIILGLGAILKGYRIEELKARVITLEKDRIIIQSWINFLHPHTQWIDSEGSSKK